MGREWKVACGLKACVCVCACEVAVDCLSLR